MRNTGTRQFLTPFSFYLQAPLRLPTGPVAVTEMATGIRVVEAILPYYNDVRATLRRAPVRLYEGASAGAEGGLRLQAHGVAVSKEAGAPRLLLSFLSDGQRGKCAVHVQVLKCMFVLLSRHPPITGIRYSSFRHKH